MAASHPMSEEQLLLCFDEAERPEVKDLKPALVQLEADYAERSLELRHTASGYRFQVRPAYAAQVSRLWDEKPAKYSRALLETLSLIAYRQPITRGEIEDIRGVVVSTSIIKTLEEREWVRVVGHRDVPGRPALFATTRAFLDYFGMRSLEQLPALPALVETDVTHMVLEALAERPTTDTVTQQEEHDVNEQEQETNRQEIDTRQNDGAQNRENRTHTRAQAENNVVIEEEARRSVEREDAEDLEEHSHATEDEAVLC